MSLNRPHIVNGQIVRNAFWDRQNCLTVVVITLLLWFSNPGNHENNLDESNWITNYGLFSILEHGNRVSLSIATFNLDCPFGLRDPDVCVIARDVLAHQKPLFYDPYDLPYTVHRCFVALLTAAAVFAYCRKNVWTGYLGFDALLSVLVHQPERPLWGLLWCIFQANFVLYPIWKVLCDFVPLQDEQSWFRLFGSPLADIAVTVVALILTAAAVNAACYHWMHTYFLRFEGILAVALGYFRGVFGVTMGPPGFSLAWLHQQLGFDFLPTTISVNAMTWTFLIACATQQSPTAAVAFFMANIAGAYIGQYQYRHLGVHAALKQVAEGFQQLLGKMFNLNFKF